MNSIAVIPARSGSKRIPNKNMTEIAGKPILCHLIEKLKSFQFFDKILVSTDSNEILKAALNSGADKIDLRPSELADDLTPSEDAIRYVIQKENIEGNDVVFCIYPFSIHLTKDDIENAREKISKYENTGDERFVIAAAPFSPNPLRHSFVKSSEKNPYRVIFPENNKKRSQDLETVYYDTGMMYAAKAYIWCQREKYWYKDNFDIIEIEEEIAIDVDNPADLKKFIREFNFRLNQ